MGSSAITTVDVERTGVADLRNAMLCGLAVVVGVGLSLPISNASFNDDWSYAQTVKRLLETGKLTYNGWASASLIAQAYWGLLWVKAFGYSQMILRLSTLPLAAIAISICYLLARRAGVRPRFAGFATLVVGLSPLYLPVASSFMTDAPGLFVILLSMYLLIRSIESAQTSAAIAWLVAGLLIGMIGGTGRQIVWVVPLLLGPYAAWLRRDNLIFVLCALIGWIAVCAGVLFTLRWFAHQPYSIPEAPLKYQLRVAMKSKAHFALDVLAIPLTAIWVIIPGLWGLLRGWTAPRALLALLILMGPVLAIGIARPKEMVAPWMGNTLSAKGVMGLAEMHAERPDAMRRPVRILVAVVVFTIASILLADLLIWLARPLTAVRNTVKFLLFPDRRQALLPAMVLFALVYCTLLLPRAASNMVYDRYMLPLMPCLLFPLMLQAQKRGELKVPTLAWVLFGLFTVYGIAINEEVMALGRARESAANRLIAAGIPRTAIDGAFEYNFQTQIQTHGYVNDPRIKIPAHAWDKTVGPTHSVMPIYRLEFTPAPDTKKTAFGTVDYFSYLYPFHRRLFIDQFRDPWWLDPSRAATHPSETRFQMMSPTDASDDTSTKTQ